MPACRSSAQAGGYLIHGRNFDANVAKYKFTGKERDKESNYDYFGARYYDARIGRWGSFDPSFSLNYSWSPYKAFLNNPLKYSDPNGHFEFDNSEGSYDTFKNLIDNIAYKIPELGDLSKALSFFTGLSISDIKSDFVKRQGPKIVLKDFPIIEKKDGSIIMQHGEFLSDTPDVIYLDASLVSRLEQSVGWEQRVNAFWIVAVLLHEYVHYGRFKNYGFDTIEFRDGKRVEHGYDFEKTVFGRLINNYKDAEKTIMELKGKLKSSLAPRHHRYEYTIEEFERLYG